MISLFRTRILLLYILHAANGGLDDLRKTASAHVRRTKEERQAAAREEKLAAARATLEEFERTCLLSFEEARQKGERLDNACANNTASWQHSPECTCLIAALAPPHCFLLSNRSGMDAWHLFWSYTRERLALLRDSPDEFFRCQSFASCLADFVVSNFLKLVISKCAAAHSQGHQQ
jgi:hypothetical protein